MIHGESAPSVQTGNVSYEHVSLTRTGGGHVHSTDLVIRVGAVSRDRGIAQHMMASASMHARDESETRGGRIAGE